MLILYLATVNLYSQSIEKKADEQIFEVTPNTERVILNTCHSYKFYPNDTLLYSIYSKDSIVINYGVPLIKSRNEVLRVICDSVGRTNNHFYLQMEYIQYDGEEWTNQYNKVRRNTHEWLNRKFFVEIDSVGNRFIVNSADTNTPALNSGGAFQPYLFFNFQEPCSDTGQPWVMMEEYDNLVENGIPMPVLKSSVIINNKGYIDTLGFKANQLSFTKTGQGSIYYREKNKSIRFTTILACGGKLNISTEYRIPVSMYQTQEQKITIHNGETPKEAGNIHWTTSYFKLLKYNRINFDSTKEVIKKKSKKIKNKK